MGRVKVRKHEIPEIPSSSMSDVAFLLLVFFIATTIFNTEQGIPMTLPGQSSAKVQMNTKNILKVQSDGSGALTLAGEPIAMHQLEAAIRERVEENEKLVVSIESHPDSNYQTMVAVLDEVKKAEAPRVSLKLRKF